MSCANVNHNHKMISHTDVTDHVFVFSSIPLKNDMLLYLDFKLPYKEFVDRVDFLAFISYVIFISDTVFQERRYTHPSQANILLSFVHSIYQDSGIV